MRIVIASNNIFRRELSYYVLSEAGYGVDEAHTIEALLSVLRTQPPDLVVLDAQLGSVEPGEALRAIRLLSEVPIIWIASGPQASALLLVDDRPADWISWPFRADELTRAVSTLLGRANTNLSNPELRGRFAGSA